MQKASELLSIKPYLSLVVASRNDDHGGDPLRRTQLFIDTFAQQCAHYQLPAEIVLVDWNPPEGKVGLNEALSWKALHSFCSAKVIQVPREIHLLYEFAQDLPLYQMIAKNVGIRRANAPFVLATNIDILFSNELIEFFSQQKLNSNSMLRVDRFDIKSGVPCSENFHDKIDYAWNNMIRANIRNKTYSLHSTDDLQNWKKEPVKSQELSSRAAPNEIHTQACGDFTLLSKEGWEEIRGYAEFDGYSFNIDSLGCFQAHYAGLLETYLSPPCCCFHIEHSKGSGWTPEGEAALFKRLNTKGIIWLDWGLCYHWGHQMLQEQKTIHFNESSWGMRDVSLPEFCFNGSHEKK